MKTKRTCGYLMTETESDLDPDYANYNDLDFNAYNNVFNQLNFYPNTLLYNINRE